MAKKSKIAKNNQRKVLVERHAARRAELKAIIVGVNTTQAEQQAAQSALQKLPRDSSATRYRNRDASDGRPRGFLRKFGLSRVKTREMAHRGELPGITKSSW